MIIEPITCTDSAKCHDDLRLLNPDIIGIVHIQNKHIIHTKDDYDFGEKIDDKGEKVKHASLKLKICRELADVGIEHIHDKMDEKEIKEIRNKVNFIKNGLKNIGNT